MNQPPPPHGGFLVFKMKSVVVRSNKNWEIICLILTMNLLCDQVCEEQ